MAEFKTGDRVVKMSGTAAGKYGTVNSVSESGTLNVTFDGERLPRFCDPERCGKVAANSDFKVGDKVVVSEYLGNTGIKKGPAYGTVAKIMTKDVVLVKIDGVDWLAKKSKITLANAVRNAKFKVGDKVRIIGGGVETIASVHPKGQGTGFGPKEVDYYATRESDGFITDDDISGVANSRAANASRLGTKVGDFTFGTEVRVPGQPKKFYIREYKDGMYLIRDIRTGADSWFPKEMLKVVRIVDDPRAANACASWKKNR